MSKSGQNCKLYVNTGTHASPTWVELKRVIDVTHPLTKDRRETSRRESGWKFERGALKGTELSFGYLYKAGSDTALAALRDSYLDGDQIEFAVMDGPIATVGSQGYRFFGEVFEFSNDEPLNGSKVVNVTAGLTDVEESGSLVEPDWYEISS